MERWGEAGMREEEGEEREERKRHLHFQNTSKRIIKIKSSGIQMN